MVYTEVTMKKHSSILLVPGYFSKETLVAIAQAWNQGTPDGGTEI